MRESLRARSIRAGKRQNHAMAVAKARLTRQGVTRAELQVPRERAAEQAEKTLMWPDPLRVRGRCAD